MTPPAMTDADHRLTTIAAAFAGSGGVRAVSPLGQGNINTTYLVELAEGEPFVLQRLNTAVFPQPRRVMGNLLVVGRHVEGRLLRERAGAEGAGTSQGAGRSGTGAGSGLQNSGGAGSGPRDAAGSGSGPEDFASRGFGPQDSGDPGFGRLGSGPGGEGRPWVFPKVLSSTSGDPWLETEGEFWRAISYVPNTTSPDKLETPAQALAVGYGLGRFHELLHDLPCDQLADTLEGFHITPLYLAYYRAVQGSASSAGRDAEREEWAHRFIAERAAWAGVLEEAKAAGELPLRPIHGDPKVTNVLLDPASGQAVALVDLDTVKPGLVHYDIGDALRSGCNPLGEETTAFEAVRFDLGLCEALLEGYGAAAHRFLSPADHHYLFDAIRLLSFELGVRFFTDHLAGNVYFHTQRPGHNLDRALVQFHLTASIEAQEREIRGLLARLREAR
jgi:Ser/Thr protein kinase RdoA (MazF antagonist)